MKHVAFPDYLGYGKLDPKTIHEQEGCLSAEYHLLGQNVMTVKCKEDKTEIQEYWQGRPLGMTWHRDLEHAILHHFICTSMAANPIYEYLMDRIARIGWVYVQHDKETHNSWKAVYYPAVYLYIIRIPIPDNHVQKVIKALENEWFYKMETDTYGSKIQVNWKHGEQEVIDIAILEIIVPIAYLYECVEWLIKQEIILPQKLYRAIVQNAFHKATSKGNIFLGTSQDDWEQYIIYYSLIKV